ncbi:hypothetical protein D6829_00975 [Candidatus Pacearchaeota archaeon]|nr:MAG: hypothetical protein D6829_00975 [Candidatus Pacearchaeota archaeon]
MKEAHPDSSRHSVEENLSNKDFEGKVIDQMRMNEEIRKKQEEVKNYAEKLTKKITQKFKFIKAVGIIPPQANGKIEEEFSVPEADSKRGLFHIVVIIPEKKFKDIAKVRLEVIGVAKEINPNLWIHVITPVDIWNLGLDSKFDVMEAISMAHPVYDKGILGALRVSNIHKSLVIGKFVRYVTSYVIAGSLVREEETKTSDVDVFIVIDDTDVKRTPRLELKEKLRGIIHSFIQRAEELSGVKNKLSPQVYLLTEFWEAVKDAHPVMFTFIRDGIPLYDRGAFLPWKMLLRMGKIRPSPEAIDMFMSSGDKIKEIVNKRIFDIAVLDIYWGVITPTQGMLMLMGQAPQNVYETARSFRETFVKKEKLIEERYADIFEEIALKYYKGYEHGKIKPGDISGADVDRLKKNALDYISRLKELRFQIEKRIGEKEIEEVYKEVFEMLEKLLGKKGEERLIKSFNDEFVNSGKFSKRYTENLRFIAKIRNKVALSKKESSQKGFKHKIDVERAKRFAQEIIKSLTEFQQRKEMILAEKHKFVVKGRDLTAEVFFLKDIFVVTGQKIQKIENNEIKDSNFEELRKQIEEVKEKEVRITKENLQTLEKIFEDFELIQ